VPTENLNQDRGLVTGIEEISRFYRCSRIPSAGHHGDLGWLASLQIPAYHDHY
jgi:hypothetical protein